jgi:hypothetical protein
MKILVDKALRIKKKCPKSSNPSRKGKMIRKISF